MISVFLFRLLFSLVKVSSNNNFCTFFCFGVGTIDVVGVAMGLLWILVGIVAVVLAVSCCRCGCCRCGSVGVVVGDG